MRSRRNTIASGILRDDSSGGFKQKYKRKSVSMKGKQKQLLGFFGLSLVTAMTAVAYSLPAPGAAAQDLNVSVTVTAENGSARVISPENNAVLTGRTTDVAISYNKVRSVATVVTCVDTESKEQVFNETRNATLTEVTGVHKESYTVPESLGNVTCSAKITATGLDGETYYDGVSFSFRAMNIPNPGTPDDPIKPPVQPGEEPCEGPNCGKFDDNNNPIVDVVVSDDVETVYVQVYDGDNNPVFVDKNGKAVPIETTRDAFKDGKFALTLPMSSYNAKAGKYVAVLTAYNGKGEVVSTNNYWFEYMPKVETPGTGSILADLNLSRADYLLTGLVAFGLVAGFATYLIFRKSRR